MHDTYAPRGVRLAMLAALASPACVSSQVTLQEIEQRLFISRLAPDAVGDEPMRLGDVRLVRTEGMAFDFTNALVSRRDDQLVVDDPARGRELSFPIDSVRRIEIIQAGRDYENEASSKANDGGWVLLGVTGAALMTILFFSVAE